MPHARRTRSEVAMDAETSPWKFHVLPWRLRYGLNARPRSSWCLDEFLTILPRRPHGALIRTPRDGVCMSIGYADPWRRRSMEFPPRCYGVGGVCTALTSAFCIFAERRESATRTPPWCDRGLSTRTGAHQTFNATLTHAWECY